MFDFFGLIDKESLKHNLSIQEDDQLLPVIIPEITKNNLRIDFNLEPQIQKYRELLEESQNQNIKLKEVLSLEFG